jgi:hypothetical protein
METHQICTSLQDPDADENGDVELGCDGREEGKDGRGEETESVDSFDPVHLRQPASNDLSRHVPITALKSTGFNDVIVFLSINNYNCDRVEKLQEKLTETLNVKFLSCSHKIKVSFKPCIESAQNYRAGLTLIVKKYM